MKTKNFISQDIPIEYRNESSFLKRVASAPIPPVIKGLMPKKLFPITSGWKSCVSSSPLLCEVFIDIKKEGGEAFIVGGFVRDLLLGGKPKDCDVEVYGLSPGKLKTILSRYGEVDCIGEHFGVFIIKGLDVDWALPRLDSNIGKGHKDFNVSYDENMSYYDATRRRDLTINSMMLNPLTNEIVDVRGGSEDLKKGILRAVCSEHFGDDPLRALRAARFSARFGFLPDQELVKIMAKQDLSSLSEERVYSELKMMLLTGRDFFLPFMMLEDSGLLRFFPDLEKLKDCPQRADYHPEGDVLTHTILALNAAVNKKTGEEKRDIALMFAVLLHDIGKPKATKIKEGNYIAYRHDVLGEPLAKVFLEKIKAPNKLICQVMSLVKNHMLPFPFYKDKVSCSAFRRLAVKLDKGMVDMQLLSDVSDSDSKGRTGAFDKSEATKWFDDKFKSCQADVVEKPAVQGRHLIALGKKPSKEFSLILKKCFEYQLEKGVKDVDEILKETLGDVL